MIEAPIEDVLSLAQDAASLAKSWHFHILSPKCCFNNRIDRYGLMVEVPADNISMVAYVSERPVEQGKMLVSLLHGSKVLDGTGSVLATKKDVAAKIVARAQQLNERRLAWHHHMLFPDCALNPHPGKWTLTFEDPESGEVLSAIYENEPIDDLKEVEALFYGQIK